MPHSALSTPRRSGDIPEAEPTPIGVIEPRSEIGEEFGDVLV